MKKSEYVSNLLEVADVQLGPGVITADDLNAHWSYETLRKAWNAYDRYRHSQGFRIRILDISAKRKRQQPSPKTKKTAAKQSRFTF